MSRTLRLPHVAPLLRSSPPAADRSSEGRPVVLRLAVQALNVFISTSRANLGLEFDMLHYAVVFLVIALIAALFGFGGIAASAVGIAKILFVIFLVLALASLIAGLIRRG